MDEAKIIDSLKSLHDLSKAINSTLNLGEVEEMVLAKTAKLMQAEKVLILLLDETKTILTLHRSQGFDQVEMPVKEFHDIRSFDHCIVHKGAVITLNEVLAYDDLRFQRRQMPFLSDMVFAPLEIKGEAYGLLGISGNTHEFSSVELEIFCSLGSQAAIALENATLYEKLHDAFLHTAEALAEAINSRDPYTGGHTRRVSQYSLQLAEALNLSTKEKEDLRLGAILHDIGKIGIDDAILRKGGIFSPEEKEIMKNHPEIGANILEHVDEMEEVIRGVRHHHEWFDGSGYPDGLRKNDIPLAARIIAIADVFDALTTDRPYRKAMKKEAAIKIIQEDAGSHFDPELLDMFSDILFDQVKMN
ncbi:MAG: HD domain-containing protein [Desulfobulbaceae bacterium]|nr:HD domain-containing protein [Desulfobulbaceae bacterium]